MPVPIPLIALVVGGVSTRSTRVTSVAQMTTAVPRIKTSSPIPKGMLSLSI